MLIDALPVERVRSLIAEGNARAALDLAKQTHERLQTPASDDLFRDSYAARVDELIERSLWAEANGMLANMRKRWPAEEDRTRKAAMRIALGRGRPDALLVRLCDPSLENEERVCLEATLRTRLTDLAILAECAAVPPDHPLRRDAQTLRAAFVAVTEGVVERDALDLPTISRRSPLAPWKLLTQAIACYYRSEDDECRRFLQAIDPQSPPGKAASALLTALQGGSPPGGGVHAEFVRDLTGNRAAIQASLRALDAAFARKKASEMRRASAVAFEECKRCSSRFAERLCTVLTHKLMDDDLDAEALSAILGRVCPTDSYFWRIFALSAEKHDEVRACALWERFRLHALHEGALAQEVSAALYLHMAELLGSFSQKELAEIRACPNERILPFDEFYEDQSPAMRTVAKTFKRVEPDSLWWLSPEKLYARAIEADLRSDTFAAWLSWANKQDASDLALAAATAWHAALPKDLPPLLVLATQAEAQGAFKKALRYLEQAERFNPLHYELRRIRLRLMLSALQCHVKQGNDHLALLDIAALRELPLLKERDGAALLAALEWGWAVSHADEKIAREQSATLIRLLRASGASIFLEGLGSRLFGLKDERMRPFLPSVSDGDESLAIGVACACALSDSFATEVRLPAAWVKTLERQVAQTGAQFTPGLLEALGRQACEQKLLPLAYVVSGAGLACGGGTVARFLVLRARTLPLSSSRRWDCLAAAAALARGVRDAETVDAAVELGHERPFDFSRGLAGNTLESASRERAEEILCAERGKKAYPARSRRGRYARESSFEMFMEFFERQGRS
jgi:hypothetical protein